MFKNVFRALTAAERLKAQFANDDALKIRRAYQLCFGRDATEGEIQLGLEFLRKRASKPVTGLAAVFPGFGELE